MEIIFSAKNGFQFNWGRNRYTKTPTPHPSTTILDGNPQMLNPDDWNVHNIAMTTVEIASVINMRATLLSTGVWKHYKMVKGEKVEVENSDYVNFLENPNVLMNGNDYLYLLDQSKSIFGNSFEYILKGSELQEIPTSLYILPTKDVKVKSTGLWYKQSNIDDIISGYEYLTNPIPTNEIMHRHTPNLLNPLMGESPLKSAFMAISNIREAYKFRNVIMVKHGALGMLTNTSQNSVGAIPLKGDERKRIEQQYQNSYGTDIEKSQLLISNASLQYQSMSFPTKDLLLFEEVSEDFMKIIDLYGMNVNLFSKTKGSTFENLSQGLKQAYQMTIIPESEEVSMNRTRLLGMDGKTEWVELDYSHVPVLQENEKEKSEVIYNKCKSTEILLNNGINMYEARQIVNL